MCTRALFDLKIYIIFRIKLIKNKFLYYLDIKEDRGFGNESRLLGFLLGVCLQTLVSAKLRKNPSN